MDRRIHRARDMLARGESIGKDGDNSKVAPSLTPPASPPPTPTAVTKPTPTQQPTAATPPASIDVTIDQLETMFTGGANGPDDIKRAEEKYRGAAVTFAGTVFEIQPDVSAIVLKGSGMTYAQCVFDGKMPKLKRGQRTTFKGVLSGYMMQVDVDHCSLVEKH
jgi:hypothetical protein